MQYQVIIVGGGASGLITAIVAGRNKAKNVLIIEKNSALGKKILVTGNGRCNLTNSNLSPDKYYGENNQCLHNIFSHFSFDNTMSFFEETGVKLKIEKDGRVFPATDKASTVLTALTKEISRLPTKVNLKERVTNILSYKDYWEVKTDKNTYYTKSVILTTGGKSYPQLGSTGDGYAIAQKLGHRVVEPKPGLVPIEIEGSWFHDLQGIKVDVGITLSSVKRKAVKYTGEIVFTHFGISGPLILDLSRSINSNSEVSINFLPKLRIQKEFNDLIGKHPRKILVNILDAILPKKLCQVLLNGLKIDTEKKLSQFTKEEKRLIYDKLTNWHLSVKGPRSFNESMVTAGGVSMDEVNPKTMESLLVKGLYFAGEVLDIDGMSGGYNLQFAWSTGYIAGLTQ
jgi:predicted Rossmann fold flavoprotein